MHHLRVVVANAFVHVTLAVLLRRCPRNLRILRDKGSLELFDLFSVFDNLTLNLWDHILARLWDILLGRIVRKDFVRVHAIKRGSWDLGPALQLRWQVPHLKFIELTLELQLFLLGDRPTDIVVVYLLLS